MPYEVNQEKVYEHPRSAVLQAALGAIQGLEGQIKEQDLEKGTLVVHFDKKILGKVLGDRTHLGVTITEAGSDQTKVAVEGYPLDALYRKLMFGARKGVTQTVVTWFFAHLEHRLKG